MSKSLGNFFTARDILKKYSSNAIRYLFNQTHYASPLSFSMELLESAEKGLEKIYNLAQRIENLTPSSDSNLNSFENERYVFAFESAMDDNLNPPKAMGAIFDFVRDFNKFINKNEQVQESVIDDARNFLTNTMTDVFGISIFKTETKTQSIESELVNLLIELRALAKKEKNYALADEIRDKLKNIGVILEDSKQGTKYKLARK